MYIYAAILILLAFVAGFVIGFVAGADSCWGHYYDVEEDYTEDKEDNE